VKREGKKKKEKRKKRGTGVWRRMQSKNKKRRKIEGIICEV
jgi:hypothetical protein